MAAIGVEVSLTRGLDLDRDLDLLRLGVLELEDVGGGFVGVVAGEPARNLRFISSMASSDGCTREAPLPSTAGLPVRLSRPERYARRVDGLSDSVSPVLNLV